jgi:hypothetical protein
MAARPHPGSVHPRCNAASAPFGLQVAGRVGEQHPGLGRGDRVGDNRVRQFLERLAESVTGTLRRLPFGGTLRQRVGETFGSTPCGHDLGHELLHAVLGSA